MDYQDIVYDVRGAGAYVTINRPEKLNAFRAITCEELIHAITKAGWDKAIAAIVLSGAGEGVLRRRRSVVAWRRRAL